MSERVHECGCGARLRYKPEWAGRSGTCKKCGARFTLPQSEPDPGAGAASGAEAEYGIAPAEIKPPRISFEGAVDADAEAERARSARTASPSNGRKRDFWGDAFRGITFMRNPGNAINVLAMCLLVTVAMVVSPFFLCFFVFVWLALYGYLAGYGFRLIVHAASDDDDFPDPFEIGGFIDGIVLPLVKVFMVSIALAIPGVLVGLVTTDPAARFGATALSYFLWPAVMLIAAIGGVFSALRLDLVARTVLSAFLPYLAIWLMLIVGLGAVALAGIAGFGGVARLPFTVFSPLVTLFLFNLVGISMLIVTMWTIGLYYRHYKDRFPWSAG